MSGYLKTTSPTGNNVCITNTWLFFTAAGRQRRKHSKSWVLKGLWQMLGCEGLLWGLLSHSCAKHLGRQPVSIDRLWTLKIGREEHQFILPDPLLKTPQGFTSRTSGLWMMLMHWKAAVTCVRTWLSFISGKATSVPSVAGEVITTIAQELAQCFIYAVPFLIRD